MYEVGNLNLTNTYGDPDEGFTMTGWMQRDRSTCSRRALSRSSPWQQLLLVLATCVTCGCLSTWKEAPDTESGGYKLDTGGGTDMSNCPSASGFPVRTNILLGYPDFFFFGPTLGETQTGYGSYYSAAGQTPWESWDIYARGPDDVVVDGGRTSFVACTAYGYVAIGEDLYYTIHLWSSPTDEHVGISATFDPPMLILPTEAAIGVSWDISSTRTFESHTGYVWSDLYEDHREIVAQETLPITISIVGEDPTEVVAWRVETAHGQTLYYADNYGLVQADDRQVYGTTATPGED